MQDPLVRLDEDRILREQIRLVLGNFASSVIPYVILCVILTWALSATAGLAPMLTWSFAVIGLKISGLLLARHFLRTPLPQDVLRRIVWTIMLVNATEGLIVASLAWITLGPSTEAGRILVFAVLAGILAGSMSRFAAIPVLYAAFSLPMLGLLVPATWHLGNDSAYHVLGIVAILYAASISLMVRNFARDARHLIQVRFQNENLLSQLRAKTEIAVAAQREAEDAYAATSKFLAAASHDLRQPVHAQGLFLDVLSRTDLDEQQRELLNNARVASAASGEMLNALLDFSRIEAGVIEPNPQAVRLQDLLHKLETELAPQADAKGIFYRSRETMLSAYVDPILLGLTLRNLITNAIRYTGRGGVLVACRRRGRNAQLEVWDTGIGIAPEHYQDIFREFHQLGNPERDRRKGLGLGLAIAKGLAHAMGQSISLSSVPGRGSVFRLSVPLTEAPIDPRAFEQTAGTTQRIQARILVIDDDEAVRAAMRPLLRSWGCDCNVAESISEAIESARAMRPDLVISDYRLREQRTGVEAIAAVREAIQTPIPALLITGDTAPQRLREAQVSGLPLLHKPVSSEQLLRAVIALLESTRSPSAGQPAQPRHRA